MAALTCDFRHQKHMFLQTAAIHRITEDHQIMDLRPIMEAFQHSATPTTAHRLATCITGGMVDLTCDIHHQKRYLQRITVHQQATDFHRLIMIHHLQEMTAFHLLFEDLQIIISHQIEVLIQITNQAVHQTTEA